MKTSCSHQVVSVFTESETLPVRMDADIIFSGNKAQKQYPVVLRKVVFHDDEQERDFTFLTNNFSLSASDIADIYKTRWQIELFFKWIKQNLKIKTFWGTSENAVRVQIWVALILALLLWIHRALNRIEVTAHRIMQLLRTSILSKNTILNICHITDPPPTIPDLQLSLEGWSC
jgi:transposase